MNFFAKLILIITSLTIFSACGKDKNSNIIPNVYVNFTIYPNTLDFIPIGSAVTVNGGFKGIIIYRYMEDEFMVYERACPYDPFSSCSGLTLDNSTFAYDSCCSSKYLILDGSPIEGPSKLLLKQYNSYYDGYSLTISN